MEFLGDRLLKRRNFLIGAGFVSGLAVTSQWRPVMAQARFSDYPFKLGVASGGSSTR
jgi:alkaline phosphatase D